MSKITDKIKEILTPEDLKVFEAGVEKMIETRVGLIESELKDKYDKLAEEYVAKKLVEELDKAKAQLVEDYDAKIKNIEKKVVTKLGSFLDHVIMEQISDETLEKIAINEVALPIVNGIKSILESNYIDVNTDGSALLKAEQTKVERLTKELSEAHGKIMESEDRLQKSASFILISEKTQGMTGTQKKRVVNLLKSKSFDEINESIEDVVSIVKESANIVVPKEINESKAVIDEIITEDDVIVEEKKSVVKEEEDKKSFADLATFYLND
jgi:hypothetical protein